MIVRQTTFRHAWEYPAGLIELGGTIITQFLLATIFGLFYYVTTSNANFRQTFLYPLPHTMKNAFIIYTTQLCCLRLTSLALGAKPFSIPYTKVTTPLPTPDKILKEIIIATLLFEIIFFFGHYILHYPPLYKRFHINDHRPEQGPLFIYCVHSIVGLWMSVTTVVVVGVQRGHVVSLWAFQALVAWSMMYMRTGRDIAGIMSHETHRVHPRFNFGAVGLLDWCFGRLYASRGLRGFLRPKKRD